MKNAEIQLFDIYPKNLGQIQKLRSEGVLSKEEYDVVLATGSEVLSVIQKLQINSRIIGTFKTYSENADKIERLLREYLCYLETLVEKYSSAKNVEHSYFSLLSKISRLQEKAGKRRNGWCIS